MKRYTAMVKRLKAAGMDLNKAIDEVSQGYCLSPEQREALERLAQ